MFTFSCINVIKSEEYTRKTLALSISLRTLTLMVLMPIHKFSFFSAREENSGDTPSGIMFQSQVWLKESYSLPGVPIYVDQLHHHFSTSPC